MVGVEVHFANTPPYHDFIEFSLKTPARISDDYAELYRSGLSLNDISEQTGKQNRPFGMPSKSTKFQSEPKDKPSKAKNLAKVSNVLGIHHSVTLTLMENSLLIPKSNLSSEKF
jgi:hypothetical protein